MYRTVAAALVVALALALASCGGSGTTTVTRAELVRRLETTCLAAQDVTREQMHGQRTATAFLHAIIANQKYVLKHVGNLETSGPSKAVFDRYKDTVRQRLAALERVASASRADYPRVLAKERLVIGATGPRSFEALVALGAKHVCT